MYREQVQRGVPIEQKEVQVRNANGALRWALISIEDLTEPGSQDHSMLATLVDIHEQKELERIKTEFLSLASHQLRAPLANLKWYIDFLLKRRAQQLSAELAEYLHKMYRRNEDMIDLVNTLLNLSRIEMGRIKVEKQQTDVSALARSVIEELETVAADKQITLSTTFEGPEQFETDGRLVRIILQNLLTNALRYTPAGGKVELRTAGGAQSMTISVSDTGVGIPPEEQDKIFAKMYRASNAQAMEANGNGIGLYMCKALAEGMGGSIAFTSALNKGTTFTVTLVR
jgi:two-component system phosphate regulon sensor histidine kinase PhoR